MSIEDLFDRLAPRFAADIDNAMKRGHYIRGDLFVDLVKATTRPNGYVLDFGCGPGRLSMLLGRAGFKVRATDPSSGMIAQARSLERTGANVNFEVEDTRGTILEPHLYDTIVCSSVIEYVSDPHELLKAFSSSLRNSGALIISFANRSSVCRWYGNWLSPPNPMRPAQHHLWTWREFHALLERSGFVPMDRPSYFEWEGDARGWTRRCARIPFLGSVGVVRAKRVPQPLADQ